MAVTASKSEYSVWIVQGSTVAQVVVLVDFQIFCQMHQKYYAPTPSLGLSVAKFFSCYARK